jgi:hypothetical protein
VQALELPSAFPQFQFRCHLVDDRHLRVGVSNEFVFQLWDSEGVGRTRIGQVLYVFNDVVFLPPPLDAAEKASLVYTMVNQVTVRPRPSRHQLWLWNTTYTDSDIGPNLKGWRITPSTLTAQRLVRVVLL